LQSKSWTEPFFYSEVTVCYCVIQLLISMNSCLTEDSFDNLRYLHTTLFNIKKCLLWRTESIIQTSH